MLDAASKKYFESVTGKQLENKLAFLKKNLPKKATRRNYQISKKQLQVDEISEAGGLQAKLQEISDRMREHLKIKRFIKILTVPYVEAGKFETIDNLYCIYINSELKDQNYPQKVAILAHEMSHFYLIYQHNIRLPDTNENELLTEVNAVYIGFGFLLLDGYKVVEEKVGNSIQSSRVGYIEVDVVKKLIVKTAYLRKQNPIWILKNVGVEHIVYFTSKLFSLVRSYYRAKKKAKKAAKQNPFLN